MLSLTAGVSLTSALRMIRTLGRSAGRSGGRTVGAGAARRGALDGAGRSGIPSICRVEKVDTEPSHKNKFGVDYPTNYH